ncbi:MAG: tetratricopeptide repeat protein [Saprospiraceae bacterium]
MASRKSKKEKNINTPKGNSVSPKNNKKNLYLIALMISLFGFLLYANTLTHGYVLDDFSQIKENYVTKQGIEGIATQWTTHARYGYRPGPGELYRPIPMTMFSLEWEIAPDSPGFSHFINVLLYALTGGILFLTLAKIWRNKSILLPLLTTLFFMAHPVHVEVVANIKSRDEIVMFLMCILTLNFIWRFLEKENFKWLGAACCTYLIALFSKENAVTFLAIFPLFIYFFSDKKLGKTLIWMTPFVVLAGMFVFIRSNVIGAFGSPGDISVLDNLLAGADDTATKLATAFLLLGKYLRTLVFPHPLGSDFGYNQIPLTGFGDWRVLLSVAIWFALGIFAVLKLGKKNLWSFIILFFLINFSISSNLIITIGTSFGDRLLYAASPAFAMALALFLIKIFKGDELLKNNKFSFSDIFQNKKIWGVAAVILFLYSAKTITRNQDWESSFTLYEKDIEAAPNSAKLNYHYGLELVKKGNDASTPEEKKSWYEKAKFRFSKAAEIYDKYHDAYAQLGLAYYREKNFPKALEYYNLALKYRSQFPLVHSNMGTLYSEMGDNVKAKELYEKAVQEDPRMVDALRNLGAINAMQGNFTEAIKWFAQGLEYDPENATLNRYLGSAYRDSGQPEKGQPFLQKADRLERGK